jgi:hypothetical protein
MGDRDVVGAASLGLARDEVVDLVGGRHQLVVTVERTPIAWAQLRHASRRGGLHLATRVFLSSYRGPLAPGQTAPVIAGGNARLMGPAE